MAVVENANGFGKHDNGLLDFDESNGLFQHASNGQPDGHVNGNGIQGDDPFANGDPFASNGEFNSPFRQPSKTTTDWTSASPVFNSPSDDQTESAPQDLVEFEPEANQQPETEATGGDNVQENWQTLEAKFGSDDEESPETQPEVKPNDSAVEADQQQPVEEEAAPQQDIPSQSDQQPFQEEAAPLQDNASQPAEEEAAPQQDSPSKPAEEEAAPQQDSPSQPVEEETAPQQDNPSQADEPVAAIETPTQIDNDERQRADSHHSQKSDVEQNSKRASDSQVGSSDENKRASGSLKGDNDSTVTHRKSTALQNREARQVAAISRFGVAAGDACYVCGKRVYPLERTLAASRTYHKQCARCAKCNRQLDTASYHLFESKLFCKPHLDEAVRGASVTQHYVRVLAQTAASSTSNRTSNADESLKRSDDNENGVASANSNIQVLANELEECRRAGVKSVRSNFEESSKSAAVESANASVQMRRSRESVYATRLSMNGAPRRAVSMQNVAAGELSLPEDRSDIISSSQNLVADELELCRSRGVAKSLKNLFLDSEMDPASNNSSSRVADNECPSGTVKRLSSPFSNGDNDGFRKSVQNHEELPENGLARKLAAKFQTSDDAQADSESIAV